MPALGNAPARRGILAELVAVQNQHPLEAVGQRACGAQARDAGSDDDGGLSCQAAHPAMLGIVRDGWSAIPRERALWEVF